MEEHPAPTTTSALEAAAAPATPAVVRSQREINLIVFCLCTAVFLASLDGTIVSVSLPTIASSFGEFQLLSWVVSAYLLTSSAVTPLYGKFSDLYGRRKMFVLAISLFTLGSTLAGASQSMWWLIAARAVQGLGGGGLLSLTQVVIGDIVTPRERGRYTGMIAGTFGISSVIGPLLGGALTDSGSTGWRFIFYLNLPFIALCLFLTYRYLNITRDKVHRKVDVLGSVVIFSATALLILAITWGGNTYSWTSGLILGLICASAALVGVFIFVETHASEPIMSLPMFKIRNYALSCLMISCSGVAMYSILTFLPQWFQIVNGLSPTQAGLRTIPLMASLVFSSSLSGALISRTGVYRHWPIIGTALFALGAGLMGLLHPDSSYGELSGFMILIGLGLGVINGPVIMVAQNSVPAKEMAVATSAAAFLRTLGGAIGVAIYGSVLTDQLNSRLSPQLAPLVAAASEVRVILANNPPALAAFIQGYADSLARTFLYGAIPMLFSFVLSFFIQHVELRGRVQTVPVKPKAAAVVAEAETTNRVTPTKTEQPQPTTAEASGRGSPSETELSSLPGQPQEHIVDIRPAAVLAPATATATEQKGPSASLPIADAQTLTLQPIVPSATTNTNAAAEGDVPPRRMQSERTVGVDEHGTQPKRALSAPDLPLAGVVNKTTDLVVEAV